MAPVLGNPGELPGVGDHCREQDREVHQGGVMIGPTGILSMNVKQPQPLGQECVPKKLEVAGAGWSWEGEDWRWAGEGRAGRGSYRER